MATLSPAQLSCCWKAYSGCRRAGLMRLSLPGKRRSRYLSPDATSVLSRWLKVSDLRSGPLFRVLRLNRPYEGALATSSIRRIIKRATRRAGLDSSIARELSGHSMRIGAAQDMMVAVRRDNQGEIRVLTQIVVLLYSQASTRLLCAQGRQFARQCRLGGERALGHRPLPSRAGSICGAVDGRATLAPDSRPRRARLPQRPSAQASSSPHGSHMTQPTVELYLKARASEPANCRI